MGIPQRLIGLAVLSLCSGCVLTEKFLDTKPTAVAPAQVIATWNGQVMVVPDPARGGMPAPGLTGRVFLFGPTMDFPIEGDGSVVVDLFDDTTRAGQTSGAMIEEWRFDPITLKRLYKRDTIGMGYTLFLPWGTYRPDITQVHLAVRYEPAHGTPIYGVSGKQSLDHSATVQ